MARTLALVLLVTTLLGCGDDDPPLNVGAACAAGTGACDRGLTCNTGFAGGYCTVACTTTGATTGCPQGSICDSVTGAGTTCVRVCRTSADCRADLDCNGVSGSNFKACKPK
jgi:hypothetical protein